ncbi:MAG: DUF3368 domain-containing protein [Chloroflexi bacterium]|nr:DUF3368 domain-containing protein [Chloroflexota bacterium]
MICNTSPVQYLHQLELLDVLHKLVGRLIVPPAVVEELAMGRSAGIDLPDLTALGWVEIRRPAGESAVPLIADLGPGESEVLMLALETPDSVVMLDDGLARRVAETRGIRFTGTLGVLLDAKRKGLIPEITPLVNQLQALRFRLAPHTRAAILRLAGES